MALFKQFASALLLVVTLLSVTVLAQSSNRTTLSQQEIRSAVERMLAEKLAGSDWEVSIRQLSIPPNLTVSKGPRELEIIAPATWDGWGAVTLTMLVRVNGAVERNQSMRLVVDAQTMMLTATRQLFSGTVLTESDLTLQKLDLAQVAGQPVTDPGDAVGKRLTVTLRSGAPIRSSQLANVPVVVSGQLVTIVIENKGLKITVEGRARSAGGVGDLVRVQNLASKKELTARVLDASTVEVGF